MSSPVTEQETVFVEGQAVAFIHSRDDCLPGKVISVNYDDTFDIEVYVPMQVTRLNWTNAARDFKRELTTELVVQPRLRVSPADPCTQFQQIKNEVGSAARETGEWSTIGTYVATKRKLPVPNMTGWHVSLQGKFFDPTLYYYQVTCWRAPYEVRGQQFPEERLTFPKKKPYYEDYAKCFNRYFREYHQALGKWNSVVIKAINPASIKKET